MNYRDKMREYIKCPQLGNTHYGKWGALNIEQKVLIKRLLDEMDRADEYIKKLYLENDKLKQENKQLKEDNEHYKFTIDTTKNIYEKYNILQQRIDKAIEYINEATNYPRGCGFEPLDELYAEYIIDRLKGDSNE